MKVLIIGVNGFLGGHLLRHLRLRESLEIIGTGQEATYNGIIPLDQYFPLDITRFKDVIGLIGKINPTHIYNMAGVIPGIRENLEDMMLQINCLGAINILESVKQVGTPTKILFVGSAAEYGQVIGSDKSIDETTLCNPIGVYGMSKYYMTKIALDFFHKWNVQVVIARPFNIIGPGMGFETVAGAFLKRAKVALNTAITADVKMGDLSAERDFLDVRDVMRACALIMDYGPAGEVFNVASGVPIKIEYIIQALQSIFQGRVRLVRDHKISKSGDLSRVYGNAEKIKKLGFSPEIKLEDSLFDSWRYEIEGNN